MDSGSSTTGRDVYKKRVDKHETLDNFAVGTRVDCVLTSETVKAKRCRVEQNTFTSTDHRAVFLET